MFICSVYMFFFHFSKKLICLLSLEFMMLVLILSFFFSMKEFSLALTSFHLIFLILMVLDSVLGICLLVNSSRFTSKKVYTFF